MKRFLLTLVACFSLTTLLLAQPYTATVTATSAKILPERGTKGAPWVAGTTPAGVIIHKDGVVYMATKDTTQEPPHADYRPLQNNSPRALVSLLNKGPADVWLSFGTPAVSGQGVLLGKDDQLFIGNYQGAIYAIGNGTVVGSDVAGGAK